MWWWWWTTLPVSRARARCVMVFRFVRASSDDVHARTRGLWRGASLGRRARAPMTDGRRVSRYRGGPLDSLSLVPHMSSSS